MCWSDLTRNVELNRKFVKMTNPTVAAYWAVVQEILPKVKAKGKYDPESGVFRLDRRYVYGEVGIPADEQKRADAVLASLGIVVAIDPADPDRIAVDAKRYVELLLDESISPEAMLTKTAKMTKAERSAAKKAGVQARIVELFGETDEVSKAAIARLVEVYYSKGVCRHAQWEPIFKTLKACTDDPNGLVELIDYVLATNYMSIPAAVDSFMKRHSGAAKTGAEQRKCVGVSEIGF